MLISAQQTSQIQKSQRTDLDPTTAAASVLYSGMLQNQQPVTNLQAAAASVAGDKQADNVNAAFAKTRVLLQASVPEAAAVQSTSTQNSNAATANCSIQAVRPRRTIA